MVVTAEGIRSRNPLVCGDITFNGTSKFKYLGTFDDTRAKNRMRVGNVCYLNL